MDRDQYTKEKEAAVAQLTTLDKEIVDFMATRENNWKKATKVIKQQIADFAAPLYQKRRADYHAIKPMKEQRAKLQQIVANCDVTLAQIAKAEKAASPVAPAPAPEVPVVATPAQPEVTAATPKPKKAKAKAAKKEK